MLDLDGLGAAHAGLQLYVITKLLEDIQGIWAETFFNAQYIRLPLMMHSWCGGIFCRVHTKIHGIDQGLQYSGNNARTARATDYQPGLVVTQYHGRHHG